MEKQPTFLSLILILGGLILISDISLLKITGNVIAEKAVVTISSFGFLFLILGIVLFLISNEGKLERNLAQQIRESGKMIDKTNDLIHIAKKMGYSLGDNAKEGTPVYDSKGKYITIIPLKGHLTWRISKNIIRDLAEGESSFRRGRY